MKKFKTILLAAALSIGISAIPTITDAASTYKVKPGDSLWKISNNFGISLLSLQQVNNFSGSVIYPNQVLAIPSSISNEEKELMARLVHAEAKGESYAGKVAVATVILNRVDHKEFPNSVKGVIYENVNGHYAFSPVKNGAINQAADAEARKAVNEALAFRGLGSGSIYFYNPNTAKSDWIKTREVTTRIGNHVFAK
ncbi:N-acetylmuramoyl-L-alanine amidase [Salirhabdus euzebyi]|uniref:N-acetylmuramoyl-L-alanine amidase n=1 Tax=Salirhabdus euzebyi TaxID=394506 RepID=A0A841PZ49_9BACI|nr:cell wall hydrolase [Salirhabdus euzebyi]MBB6452531.1 N-acetylmuramoyl-L-alanine amidase [Salirhabdus euzebyi]